MKKLAIITSHPIQYYAPWFRHLAERQDLQIKVFYLWNFGINSQIDADFKQVIQWDIPLLEGYDYEFVANTTRNAGTYHFWGLQNPSLIKQVSSFNPDAVLLMIYNYASIYRFLLQWNSRKAPLIFRGDSHRLLIPTGAKAYLRRSIIQQIYHRFAACLYVGKANYEYFRYHDVKAENLFFSPHAVDNDRFFAQAETAYQQAAEWKQELGIPQNHAVILFAGKFETKKRPVDLLQAFLQANLVDVSLLFVGAGHLEKELRSQATGNKNVYFAPFQNQSLMPRTYVAADLVVLPSYGSGETWGLVINEAMCMRRPILTSTHVGCTQDLVRVGENGMTFPAGNVATLKDCLEKAFSNKQQLQQWGENSHRIISEYSYTQATAGLIQALHHVVKREK